MWVFLIKQLLSILLYLANISAIVKLGLKANFLDTVAVYFLFIHCSVYPVIAESVKKQQIIYTNTRCTGSK